MTNELLSDVNALRSDPTLSEAASSYLADHGEDLAKLIERSGSRQDFLALNGMSETIYTEIRTKLNGKRVENAKTTIVAIKGRRGGLRLVQLEEPSEIPVGTYEKEAEVREKAETFKESELTAEKSYYPLAKTWAQSNGYPDCVITPGLPGYKWENPDLLALSYYVSQRSRTLRFEITSFEVKLRVEPSAIWQAAHYRRFSTEIYVAFATSETDVRELQGGRVFDLAVELGLGVLAFDKDSRTFKLLQSPRTWVPDENEVDEVVNNYQKEFGEMIAHAMSDHAASFKVEIK